MTEPAVHIDGLYNFRDTGGMPLATGGTSRPGVLFRSDALSAVSPAGLAELAGTTIGVVVDLRTSLERQLAPNLLPASRPFRAVGHSILTGSMTDMAASFMGDDGVASPDAVARALDTLPSLGELYVGMLRESAPAFAEVARLVAASTDDEPSAVLVHCTAGKDRTGVMAALMLDAVGAHREAIVADYALSQENLAGPWAEKTLGAMAAFGLPLTPELRSLATLTPPDAIERALSWIDDGFGGAEAYLVSGGLTDAELAALRSRLAG